MCGHLELLFHMTISKWINIQDGSQHAEVQQAGFHP